MQEFNPDSVNAYIEHVNLLFTVNEVPAQKQVAVFFSVIEGKTYENLLSPKLPETLTFLALDVFKAHYEPKPLVFTFIAVIKQLVNISMSM